MNKNFEIYAAETPQLFEALDKSEIVDFSTSVKNIPKFGGIYRFWERTEDWRVVYVGRTRNFHQRFSMHVRFSPYSASFAFKRTRSKLKMPATYKKKSGAKAMMKDEKVQSTFRDEIESIKRMRVQYLRVDDPIAQYLLELYSAMDADLDLSDFDTH